MRKKALVSRGVLRADASGSQMLRRDNVDMGALLALGRLIADVVGIPKEAPFAEFHPVQLFDFSSRARCVAPFRVLAVDNNTNLPVCLDLEVSAVLRDAQSRWHADEVGGARSLVETSASDLADLDAQIAELASAHAAAAQRAHEAAHPAAQQIAQVKVAELEAALARARGARPAAEGASEAAEGKLRLKLAAQAEWEKATRTAQDAKTLAPMFPVGDALLEPFWPQGLGANRGFHSALDAAWAMAVLDEHGLDRALVERAFNYDVMLHATFTKGVIQPGAEWTADPLTRYQPAVVKGCLMAYEDPRSKRAAKGRAAIPERYLKLVGASLAVMGKATNVAPGLL